MAYMFDASFNVSNVTASNFTGIPEPTVIVTITICVFSLVGSLIIFLSHCLVSELRRYDSRKLLLYLTIADCLTAFGNLLGALRYEMYIKGQIFKSADAICLNSDKLCVAQSVITTFSSLASFFWTLVIAFHLLATVKWESRAIRMSLYYHLLCWGVPGILTIAAAGKGVLGDNHLEGTGSWCWIKGCIDHDERILWMLFTGKFWEVLTYLLAAWLFVVLKIHIFKVRRQGDALPISFRDGDERFTLVWLILYLLRMWGTIRFLMAWITDDNNFEISDLHTADRVLLYLQCFGDSAQAGFNCILFCLLDKKIWRRLRERCCQSTGERELLVNHEDR
ncbi:hypothetical protein ScPMuIL_008978 [Solemya velum]